MTGVEPGGRLLALTERKVRGEGQVEFVNRRLEDAPLARSQFRVVFSASAFHWIDPDVGWRRVAEALVPGGTLVLIQYFGVSDERTAVDQEALLRPWPGRRRRSPRAAWETFLGALDGAPTVIVTDADHALALAIKGAFGETVEQSVVRVAPRSQPRPAPP